MKIPGSEIKNSKLRGEWAELRFATRAAERIAESVQSFLCLNGFELVNASNLKWPVQVLEIVLKSKNRQTHDDLGTLRNIVWDLRKKHNCRGYGFVVDAGEFDVAIPATWKLPLPIETPEFNVRRKSKLVADVSTLFGRRIVARIVKEAVKACFRRPARFASIISRRPTTLPAL